MSDSGWARVGCHFGESGSNLPWQDQGHTTEQPQWSPAMSGEESVSKEYVSCVDIIKFKLGLM